jgi:hypothetical protein
MKSCNLGFDHAAGFGQHIHGQENSGLRAKFQFMP